MSMLHKAFCFDTKSFYGELAQIITISVSKENVDDLLEFIRRNVDRITSPYTEEPIGDEGFKELAEMEIQELIDFALTCYYNISEDIGLEYSWDAISEYLVLMNMKRDASFYILGESFCVNGFKLDPGRMGMGFIQAVAISDIKKELISQQEIFRDTIISKKIDPLYSLTKVELEDAYLSLIAIYEQAEREMKGLMFTF